MKVKKKIGKINPLEIFILNHADTMNCKEFNFFNACNTKQVNLKSYLKMWHIPLFHPLFKYLKSCTPSFM